MTPLFKLELVELNHEVQVEAALCQDAADLGICHAAVVQRHDGREGSAWRRAYQPSGLPLVDQSSGLVSIRLQVEVPWSTIWLVRPDVERGEAFYVQRPAWPIGILYNGTSAVHFNE